ncbi:serine/threonine-protein kinase [Calycomorphotria hydatis]|uniref:Serine/threonine-protein kinase PknF n=1 Tax=Calycomorphotria hydatis TaxID=2528027 RepID=A0A517T8S4_9PLAN|nr:serine/threonine-protein kinase [Calycomorphotria hydatis]QDT64775.1 Serine/threonine-protein kinase PknF [Calycomorphotria hydatis]
MKGDAKLDELLDEWDKVLESDANYPLDRFISEHVGEPNTRLAQAFRRQAAELASIEQVMEKFAAPNPASTHTKTRNKLRIADLRAGLTPIRGYKLVSRLGGGGFGEVWKAKSPGGFHVALKFVPVDGQIGNVEKRSLAVIKDVRHPHLLGVFGTWRIGNLLVIATELADRTLYDRLQEAQSAGLEGIPRDELFAYFVEAAKGIDFLNNPGKSDRTSIQHRDIKPQNLLLSGGSVKVGDFGLARSVERDHTGHTGSLTFAYAAPEFFDGKTSSRSDQYSLAVTYYYLRCGRLPFDGTQVEIMEGHRKKKPDLSRVTAAERLALEKALAKNPKNRWPSCHDFVTQLQATPSKSNVRRSTTSSFRSALKYGLFAVISACLVASVWHFQPSLSPWIDAVVGDNSSDALVNEHGHRGEQGLDDRAEKPASTTKTSTAVAIDVLAGEIQSRDSKKAEIEKSISTIFADYPLNIMSFSPSGEFKVSESNTLVTSIRCAINLKEYQELISEVCVVAKEHAVENGTAVFPTESAGTRLNYAKALDGSPLDSMRKILYKDDTFSKTHSFVIVGQDLASAEDDREKELHANWYLLPSSFGASLLTYFEASAGVTLNCELLDAQDNSVATRFLNPMRYTTRNPQKAANLPFYPVGGAWSGSLIDLDYDFDDDYYRYKNILVFLPTLLTPKRPQDRYTPLMFSKTPYVDIPIEFEVDLASVAEALRLQVEATVPNH